MFDRQVRRYSFRCLDWSSPHKPSSQSAFNLSYPIIAPAEIPSSDKLLLKLHDLHGRMNHISWLSHASDAVINFISSFMYPLNTPGYLNIIIRTEHVIPHEVEVARIQYTLLDASTG